MLPNKTSRLFNRGEFPAILTVKNHRSLRIEQVFVKEMLPNGKPWTIYYISRWSLSFFERLKCLFAGRLYVIVQYNPHREDSAPVHPTVSFAEPKLHKRDPFEDVRNEIIEQREKLV